MVLSFQHHMRATLNERVSTMQWAMDKFLHRFEGAR